MIIARVELHGARTRDDYAFLHNEMARRGFVRCLSANDGQSLHLPTGTYALLTAVDVKQALNSAAAAADATGYSWEAFVADGTSWWSRNLSSC